VRRLSISRSATPTSDRRSCGSSGRSSTADGASGRKSRTTATTPRHPRSARFRRSRLIQAAQVATTYGKFPLRRCSDTRGVKPEGTALSGTSENISSGAPVTSQPGLFRAVGWIRLAVPLTSPDE
jgi:hypothetical protein